MSFVDIPFIGGLAYIHWLAITPPREPPSSKEVAAYGDAEPIFKRVLSWGGWLSKVGLAVYAAAEILSILAVHYSVTQTTGPPLSAFAKSGVVATRRFSGISLVGYVLAMSGGIFRVRAIREMGRMFTFAMTIREKHELISTGPYAFVRHPGYTGNVMLTSGLLMYLFAPGSFMYTSGVLTSVPGCIAVFSWVAYKVSVVFILTRRIPTEDRVLRKEFGCAWDEWAERVPWRLVPLVY